MFRRLARGMLAPTPKNSSGRNGEVPMIMGHPLNTVLAIYTVCKSFIFPVPNLILNCSVRRPSRQNPGRTDERLSPFFTIDGNGVVNRLDCAPAEPALLTCACWTCCTGLSPAISAPWQPDAGEPSENAVITCNLSRQYGGHLAHLVGTHLGLPALSEGTPRQLFGVLAAISRPSCAGTRPTVVEQRSRPRHRPSRVRATRLQSASAPDAKSDS